MQVVREIHFNDVEVMKLGKMIPSYELFFRINFIFNRIFSNLQAFRDDFFPTLNFRTLRKDKGR